MLKFLWIWWMKFLVYVWLGILIGVVVIGMFVGLFCFCNCCWYLFNGDWSLRCRKKCCWLNRFCVLKFLKLDVLLSVFWLKWMNVYWMRLILFRYGLRLLWVGGLKVFLLCCRMCVCCVFWLIVLLWCRWLVVLMRCLVCEVWCVRWYIIWNRNLFCLMRLVVYCCWWSCCRCDVGIRIIFFEMICDIWLWLMIIVFVLVDWLVLLRLVMFSVSVGVYYCKVIVGILRFGVSRVFCVVRLLVCFVLNFLIFSIVW